MGEENQTQEKVKGTKAKEIQKFKLSALRSKCFELFGVSKSAFDGAVFNLDVNTDYSIDEIKRSIETWNKKGVK